MGNGAVSEVPALEMAMAVLSRVWMVAAPSLSTARLKITLQGAAAVETAEMAVPAQAADGKAGAAMVAIASAMASVAEFIVKVEVSPLSEIATSSITSLLQVFLDPVVSEVTVLRFRQLMAAPPAMVLLDILLRAVV